MIGIPHACGAEIKLQFAANPSRVLRACDDVAHTHSSLQKEAAFSELRSLLKKKMTVAIRARKPRLAAPSHVV